MSDTKILSIEEIVQILRDRPDIHTDVSKMVTGRINSYTVYHDLPTQALMNRYYYIKHKNKPMEPDLAAEMAHRFPDRWDPETQTYVSTHVKKRILGDEFNALFDKPISELQAEYNRQMQEDGKISDTLHHVFCRRQIARYDRENRILKERQPREKTTDIDTDAPTAFAHLDTDKLVAFAAQQIETNGTVNEDMHRELVRRNITSYYPQKRRFKSEERGRKRKDLKDLTDSAIKHRYYSERKSGRVSDAINNEMAMRFGEQYDPLERKFDATSERKTTRNLNTQHFDEDEAAYAAAALLENKHQKKKPAPIVTGPKEIQVTVERIGKSNRYTLNANGKKLETFYKVPSMHIIGDGTLLAAHGIVTGTTGLPETPIWRVYNTDLEMSRHEGYDEYSNRVVYAKSVINCANNVQMNLSNGIQIIMEVERLKRRAQGRIFQMANQQKTK